MNRDLIRAGDSKEGSLGPRLVVEAEDLERAKRIEAAKSGIQILGRM